MPFFIKRFFIKRFFKSNWKRFIYIIVFLFLTYISPFKDAIFNLGTLEEFSIIGIKKTEDVLPVPVLVTPLTEKSRFISGRHCIPDSAIYIFINQTDTHEYSLVSDKTGKFEQPVKMGKLKPGDLVWLRQVKKGKKSGLSPAYNVINSDLHSWYTEKEKNTISSLQNIIMLLLSWTVLIIGGIFYLAVKERDRYKCIILLIVAIFLFVLSIYYGVSCISSIVSAVGNGVSVSEHGSIDKDWWKQLQLFQQAIFVTAIFIIWNMVSYRKRTQKDKGHENSKANNSINNINFYI